MLEFVRRASKGEVVQDEISEKRKNIIMCKVNFEIFQFRPAAWLSGFVEFVTSASVAIAM